MTIRFIFRRDRPDTESVKIRGEAWGYCKKRPYKQEKAIKTTFSKGFSGILQKHFRGVFHEVRSSFP